GNLGDLRPQADDQRGRATDDEQAADDFTPTDIALFHEGVEHFGERASRSFWRRRSTFALRLRLRSLSRFLAPDKRGRRLDYDFVRADADIDYWDCWACWDCWDCWDRR